MSDDKSSDGVEELKWEKIGTMEHSDGSEKGVWQATDPDTKENIKIQCDDGVYPRFGTSETMESGREVGAWFNTPHVYKADTDSPDFKPNTPKL